MERIILEETMRKAEFELWNAIIGCRDVPKVVSMELQEAHMHLRQAMKILKIQRRMEE
tara:strand:- start:40 stop:213 length:174 start_codon:yes stop_codon:yes gene_type:complete